MLRLVNYGDKRKLKYRMEKYDPKQMNKSEINEIRLSYKMIINEW